MKQTEQKGKELACFIGNLNLDRTKNDKLSILICEYVKLNRDEVRSNHD